MKKPHPQLAQKEKAFYKKFFFIWVLPVRWPRQSLLQAG